MLANSRLPSGISIAFLVALDVRHNWKRYNKHLNPIFILKPGLLVGILILLIPSFWLKFLSFTLYLWKILLILPSKFVQTGPCPLPLLVLHQSCQCYLSFGLSLYLSLWVLFCPCSLLSDHLIDLNTSAKMIPLLRSPVRSSLISKLYHDCLQWCPYNEWPLSPRNCSSFTLSLIHSLPTTLACRNIT